MIREERVKLERDCNVVNYHHEIVEGVDINFDKFVVEVLKILDISQGTIKMLLAILEDLR